MKRDVLLEAQILKAIEVLGEATGEEILAEIKEQFDRNVEEYEFTRNVRRWLARKCITVSNVKGENAYKLRDVPPFFKSLQIYQMKGLTAKAAESIITKLEIYYDAQKATPGKGPLIKGYNMLRLTFKTLDKVAGGDQGAEDRNLVFPRKDGKPYIRRNWVRGLFRDNARLADINETFMAERVGFSDSETLDVETSVTRNVKVKEGLCAYETIPAGTEFTVDVRFPFQGSWIKSVDDVRKFVTVFENAPLKGLGAYSNYFGGRIALTKAEDLGPVLGLMQASKQDKTPS